MIDCYRCCVIWNKIKVFFGGKRSLCGHWTIEPAEELASQHGLDVEEELAKALTEEINKVMIEEHGPNWKQEADDRMIAAIQKAAEEMKDE